MKTLFWFLCTIIAPATSLFGQQDPVGIQPFGTQFGPIDAATLNVHLSIPVVNKAGTLPFHYDLTFNNNFWSSFQGPTVRYWANGNHGWSSFTLFHGASFKSTEGELCADNVRFQLTYTQFTDPEGNAHPVGIRVDCGAPVTSTLIDGSGISVT